MKYLMGIDIGGTNIVCGLVDLEGNLVGTIKFATDRHKAKEAIIDQITVKINELLLQEQIGMDNVIAVGVGTPGIVDPIKGISILSGNLHWKDVPLAHWLSEQVHKPVFIDNDVRMYIYGEAMAGRGQGYDHVFGLTIGTGIASASVNKGVLYYGGGYLAGEFGHIPMDGIEEPCHCGLIGCLETIVSATGIARQAKQAIDRGQESILQKWVVDRSYITALDVSKAFDLKDELAINVMNDTGKMLGKALSHVVPLMSPDIIIIGGGVAAAGNRLMIPMRDELQRRLHPMYWDRLVIKPAQHIEFAGVLGSALYAKSRL